MFEQKYWPWAERKLAAATRRSRESTHKHIVRFFGPLRLADITKEKIDEFAANRLAEGIIYDGETDRLGRPLNRAPRPLSLSGLAEQLTLASLSGLRDSLRDRPARR